MQEVTGSSPVPSTTSPQAKRSGDFFRGGRYRTRTARAERSEGNQSPSGALISARFPTARNVYRDDCRFVVDGTGLEQQRRRPPPAAKTGSRGWGRVLIFQSPAKGLRKNQQTQPVQAPAVRFRQGSQRLGMSTGMTAVLWWAVQDENRNKQRQGIIVAMVSCLLCYMAHSGAIAAYVRTGRACTPLERCNTLGLCAKVCVPRGYAPLEPLRCVYARA